MQSGIINQWLKPRMYILLLHFKSACLILSPTNVRDCADIHELLYLPKHSTTAMVYRFLLLPIVLLQLKRFICRDKAFHC